MDEKVDLKVQGNFPNMHINGKVRIIESNLKERVELIEKLSKIMKSLNINSFESFGKIKGKLCLVVRSLNYFFTFDKPDQKTDPQTSIEYVACIRNLWSQTLIKILDYIVKIGNNSEDLEIKENVLPKCMEEFGILNNS